MAETDSSAEFEQPASYKNDKESDQVRRVIGDVYTFVRSSEINRTIGSFTLDHYLDEAKRRIKDPRIIRSASDPSKGTGTRPSKLDTLLKLEEDFNKAYDQAALLAKNVGAEDEK